MMKREKMEQTTTPTTRINTSLSSSMKYRTEDEISPLRRFEHSQRRVVKVVVVVVVVVVFN